MTDLSAHDPTARFSSRAGDYAARRPGYPESAIARLFSFGSLDADSLVVDVGCGTGISSRQLAERGVNVLGIEPNEEMRRQAEQTGGPERLHYQAGRAEATGLPDAAARAVVSAQAFHWFDAPAALREFHRILGTGGWVALLNYERDESDPFTREYGDAIRLAPDAETMESTRQRACEALLESALFEDGERTDHPHAQDLDEPGLIRRAFSTSYVPQEGAVAEAVARRLREAFARHQHEGRVVLRYVTALYLARKRANPS